MERTISYQAAHRNLFNILLGVLAAVAFAAAAGYGVYAWQQHNITAKNASISSLQAQLKRAQNQPAPSTSAPPTVYASAKGTRIIVYEPLKGAKVTSPVAVIGEVPGNWSFEASFPVELRDGSGRTVAQTTGHVLGEWTTDRLVPFSASLTYTGTQSGLGSLVLHKDNPSGEAQNDDQLVIPVQF